MLSGRLFLKSIFAKILLMKNIVILGSTGSIGVSALKVIKNLGSDYRVLGLCANTNWKILLKQAKQFKPKFICLYDNNAYRKAKNLIPKKTKLLPPHIDSLKRIASHSKCDIVINGLSGSIGFAPTLAAIRTGKTVALANKEPIVMAGAALMRECLRYGAKIIPIDSEPSAVFQCLNGANIKQIKKIILTASGGPFFRYRGDLSQVTIKQALSHPKWKMGNKITIDSATLMNKGLEAIEIMHLFSVPLSKIEIVVHPQSIIHSAVEYEDGSVIAQMSEPDMKLPIKYALTYPERIKTPVKRISLTQIQKLEFYKPDFRKFPCLKLALLCGKKDGGYPAVLNAADEVCVDAFISGKIKFTDIPKIIQKMLKLHISGGKLLSINRISEISEQVSLKTREIIKTKFKRKIKC